MTSPENAFFNKVIVNRLWKKMFGVALIEPLDELRDDTKAMVPEVEAYLEKLMVALHSDMRAFLAIVANTRAYQSEVSSGEFDRGGTSPAPCYGGWRRSRFGIPSSPLRT